MQRELPNGMEFCLVLMVVVSVALLMYVTSHEKSLFPLSKDFFIRGLLERTEANAPSNDRTGSFCNITFDLGMCPCNRSVPVTSSQGCPGESESDEVLGRLKDVYGESTCSDWATLRGPHQRVVSFSVYGDFASDYYRGVDLLVSRVAEAYPGWTLRLYHRLDTANVTIKKWLCRLACKYPHFDSCHVERLPVLGNITSAIGRVWRFGPMGDPLVDRYLVRDSDSPILQREVDAVHTWLLGGKCFHIMRDHPFHGAYMMAGMWGGCGDWQREKMRQTRDLILQRATHREADQEGLANILWPIAKSNVTMHDSYLCKDYPGSQPFPSRRINFDFVGQRSYMKKFRRERISTECPVECRPQHHSDWLYC